MGGREHKRPDPDPSDREKTSKKRKGMRTKRHYKEHIVYLKSQVTVFRSKLEKHKERCGVCKGTEDKDELRWYSCDYYNRAIADYIKQIAEHKENINDINEKGTE